MLEAVVENIPELSSVKDIDTNMAAKGGKLMTYAQYKDTLIAAATRRDERLKPASVRANAWFKPQKLNMEFLEETGSTKVTSMQGIPSSDHPTMSLPSSTDLRSTLPLTRVQISLGFL